ncbi:hypothetical protein MPER_11148 [Moniliophthora perniciosa FA553]|nr:hypothetical protein MPER_11148 [Moniliophthora perniciosa FA553]
MDNVNWCTQTTSDGSFNSPYPTHVDNLCLCSDDTIGTPDHLGTRDVIREVLKGSKKSWKTMVNGEMPSGLQNSKQHFLKQDDSRETKALGHFPIRNSYISAYIYQKTGEHRTAKQVGSRLQQLRDTCSTRKSSPTVHYGSLQHHDLPYESASGDDSAPAFPISDSEAAWRQNSSHAVIPNIDPTLTFIPRCNLDWTPSSGASEVEGAQFYTTSLVPAFWRTIYPTEYTIKHQIEQDTLTPSVLFSAIYKFRYPMEVAARLPESFSDFDVEAAHHSTAGPHSPLKCAPASEDAFGSLTELGYNGGASLPSTNGSEASMSSGYSQDADRVIPKTRLAMRSLYQHADGDGLPAT